MSGLNWTQSNGVGQIINAHSSGGGVNVYDNSTGAATTPIVSISSAGDISCNNFTTTGSLYIGSSMLFRYVPWTMVYNDSVASGVTPSTGQQIIYTSRFGFTVANPTLPASGAWNWNYSYSIIGNTMYLHYSYFAVNAGGAGSGGAYQYIIPGGYTINTNIAIPNTNAPLTQTGATLSNGSRIGSFGYSYGAGAENVGGIVIANNTTSLVVLLSVAAVPKWHGSNSYAYNLGNLIVSFEAAIPIN